MTFLIRTILSATIVILLVSSAAFSQTAREGEKLFNEKCLVCHTLGKKMLGPDLVGVTSRREESWLKRQIKEPDVMIAEKDPIVMQLLQEANNLPMVPMGLSDADVLAVIAYLKSTETKTVVATGYPAEYMPTVLTSIVVLIGLTLIGLRVGNKKVDVR